MPSSRPARTRIAAGRSRASTPPQSSVDLVFHALGDPTRRAIVERLSRGPTSVSELATPLAITLAAVVQHLQVLEDSGLVRTHKQGRVRTCRMEPAGLTILERWIASRRALWERRLDRLGNLLAEEENR
jgi:DNA-binding transcriptional ArsR family regulator